MRVFVEAQREMAQRISGVARLLERTQHEVGKDALFGLANHLSNEPLIVLWRDAQFAAWKCNAHRTLAAFAVGIRAASFRGRRSASVSHGKFVLMQILDGERIAESAGQLFVFKDFAGVRLLVPTLRRVVGSFDEVARPRTGRSQHALIY